MKFSMNGFRKQLSNDVDELREMVKNVLNDDYIDKDDLVEAMNDVITHSNVINCVYDDDDPNFSDISDIEIKHLEFNEIACRDLAN